MGGAADLIWLALVAIAFWFFLIRPQRRRQLEMLETQRAVSVGDEVLTNAGFFGRVTAEVDDPAAGDCLLLELAPGVEAKIARGAVLRVLADPVDAAPVDAQLDEPEAAPDLPEDPASSDDPHRSN